MPMQCSVKRRDGKRVSLEAFREFRLKNSTVIGVFQGSYGENPDLDILIKYHEPGKRVRTPQHLHWAIDLLIKKEHKPRLTKAFVEYLAGMWDKVVAFRSKAEQQACELRFTNARNLKKFESLNRFGEYPVEFIGHVIELIVLEEKTGNRKAFMFKGLLDAIHDDAEIFDVVSKASFKGS